MLQEIAVRPDYAVELRDASTAASDFARASKSAATRRAYQTDAADFVAWCERHGLEALPATVDTVAAYLAASAKSGLKASTITRRCAGIRYMHRMAGLELPTNSEGIKAVLAGIRRSIGTAVTRKAPATAETIRVIIADMPSDLRGLRDRALLLLGFAGALRRSELVALDVADLEESTEGLHVRIKQSKTDQEGAGDFVSIPHGSRLRPVAAVKSWLEAAGPRYRAAWLYRAGMCSPGAAPLTQTGEGREAESGAMPDGNVRRQFSAMCGRLQVGKSKLHVALLVGAAMCRWGSRPQHQKQTTCILG